MAVEPFTSLANGEGSPLRNGHIVPRLSIHQEEKDLPGGGRWVVQKFGGTSVGKFARSICSDIIASSAANDRIAVVCSARSTRTKSEGTTNRLLRAAREAEKPGSRAYHPIIQAIREDHIAAAREDIRNEELLAALVSEIDDECDNLVKILESAQHLEEVSVRAEDKIVSKGEKLSCRYMAVVLQDLGINGVFIDLCNILKGMPAVTEGARLDEAFFLEVGRRLAYSVHDAERTNADKTRPIVPVLTGYFGPIPGGLLPALGRGYTDLCAALLAVGLDSAELQVWKEVDGIFTADPRKVPTARLLPSVTPSEAAELTFYGSEVIHPFTMEQVIRARIPIRIKNVMNPRGAGTVIFPDPVSPHAHLHSGAATPNGTSTPGSPTERKLLFRTRSSLSIVHAPTRSASGDGRDMAAHLRKQAALARASTQPKRPTAVTVKHNIVILNVHSNKRTRAHGFLMNIFNILDRHHLSVDLISSSEVHVSMALHSSDPLLAEPTDRPYTPTPNNAAATNGASVNGGAAAMGALSGPTPTAEEEGFSIASAALHAAVSELAEFGTIDIVPHCAIVSLVGKQLRNMVGIAGRFLSTLGREGINIEMISQGASEINISCVIEERDADRALSVVHTNLFTFLDD